jgi:hypothetical protein
MGRGQRIGEHCAGDKGNAVTMVVHIPIEGHFIWNFVLYEFFWCFFSNFVSIRVY